MTLFRFTLRLLRSSALLGCLVLAGYLAQSFLVNQHLAHHFSEKILSSSHSASVADGNCSICDSVQLAPTTPKVTIALEVAPAVGLVPQLPPIFNSGNAILRPFGARAPPC